MIIPVSISLLLAVTTFSAPQLPPGVDPAACPNYPFCGASPAPNQDVKSVSCFYISSTDALSSGSGCSRCCWGCSKGPASSVPSRLLWDCGSKRKHWTERSLWSLWMCGFWKIISNKSTEGAYITERENIIQVLTDPDRTFVAFPFSLPRLQLASSGFCWNSEYQVRHNDGLICSRPHPHKTHGRRRLKDILLRDAIQSSRLKRRQCTDNQGAL